MNYDMNYEMLRTAHSTHTRLTRQSPDSRGILQVKEAAICSNLI
jgi:hypothetical protein